MEKAYRWDNYFEHVRRYLDSGRLDPEELAHKRALERDLGEMRDAVLAGKSNWADVMKKKDFNPNFNRLCYWRDAGHMRKWFQEDPLGSRDALRQLWAAGDQSRGTDGSMEGTADRIRAFANRMPSEIKGAGTRMRPISVLLMPLGAERYPPFKTTEFKETYKYIGYPPPPESDEAGLYVHALRFLDRFIEEARTRRLECPRDRLEAQSVLWGVASIWKKEKKNENEETETVPDTRLI